MDIKCLPHTQYNFSKCFTCLNGWSRKVVDEISTNSKNFHGKVFFGLTLIIWNISLHFALTL